MTEFKKAKGRVKKDVVYFSGLHTTRRAQGKRGPYAIVTPDMETLRSVWAELNPTIEFLEGKTEEIGIFQKESITDADCK